MNGDWPECPHCPGEELINADRPGYYECGYCNKKYQVSDFEKPQPKAAAGPALVLPSRAVQTPLAHGRSPGRSQPPTHEKKETLMALAKDDQNKLRLWQLNNRRRMKGLSTFDSLQKAIEQGAYKPRGKNGAGTAEPAPVMDPPTSPLTKGGIKGGWRGRREHAASPAPAPAPTGNNGHGTERDLSMLGGVIIQELQKERAALDLAISVIERRFQGVKVS